MKWNRARLSRSVGFVSRFGKGAAILSMILAASVGKAGSLEHANNYLQINLVSDLPGAVLQDTNLVNAWGMSFNANSPFWISDNGTGKATLYAVTYTNGEVHVAKQALEVNIPGEGNPTGQAFNGGGGFNGDIFLFVSEDGTVSGWRPALGTNAEVLASRPTAVYKGMTVVPGASGPVLLAANFSEGRVDAYRGATNATLATQFSDGAAPDGYAPFNVQTVAGHVFVTFAKQDADRHDDVAGRGHGRATDPGGAHQAAVGHGFCGTGPLCGAEQRTDVAKAAHRVQAPVELAVLVIGDADPHPRAERDDENDDRERRDDDDGAQRQHPHRQPQQPIHPTLWFQCQAQSAKPALVVDASSMSPWCLTG